MEDLVDYAAPVSGLVILGGYIAADYLYDRFTEDTDREDEEMSYTEARAILDGREDELYSNRHLDSDENN